MIASEPPTSIIYACSACGGLIRETSCSGNNLGVRIWSDGKEEVELLSDSHWMVMCAHCHSPVWLDELEGFEEVVNEPSDDGLEWPDLDLVDNEEDELEVISTVDALDYVVPSFTDYVDAVAKVVKFPEKIFELRLRAWWKGNDMRRGQTVVAAMTAAEVDNLLALLALFNADIAYEQYLKAEALRELGRFTEAATVLAAVDDEDMAGALETVTRLIAQEDASLVLLTSNA